MKSYKELTESLHPNYNEWHEKVSKHPKFARFAKASDTRLKAIGGAKTTIYALDHQEKPVGVYSHGLNHGKIYEESVEGLLGPLETKSIKCSNCGTDHTMNLHWDKSMDRKPTQCVGCKAPLKK